MAKFSERKFPSEILKLEKEVENLTGNKVVRREGRMTMNVNETLMGRMEDGIPTIIIKSGHTPTDEDIYDELSHLYLKAKSGIYATRLDGDLEKNLQERDCADVKLILGKTHSILHHSFFFNKMVKEGCHPTKRIEGQLKGRLNGYPDNSYVPSDKDIHVALDVWHLALGKNDKDSEVDDLLGVVKQRCPRAYDVGMSLFEASNKFLSPSDEPEVLTEVIKKLFCYEEEVNHAVENNTAVYS